MDIVLTEIKKLKGNPKNPRSIKGEKFKQLVESLRNFPEMLSLRPIITNEEGVVLGGNMRLKAAIEIGMKEVPVAIAKGLSEEKQKEFIIKDNVAFGQWDYDALANEWKMEDVNHWGLDLPSFSDVDIHDFFRDHVESDVKANDKIILKFPVEQIEHVRAALLDHGKTYEEGLLKLLGL